MISIEKVTNIVEAVLLAHTKPMSLDQLLDIFDESERPAKSLLKEALAQIDSACEGRGFELKLIASGYRFQVRQEYAPWVSKLWEERPTRYSRALLETLALIAYRQPITRGDIEDIRGVAVSSNIIRTLVDREWIRVVGHKDVPGRPAMYATTKLFLDYFNMASLEQLPPLSEIRNLEEIGREVEARFSADMAAKIDEESGQPGAGTTDDARPNLAEEDASQPQSEAVVH